VWEKAEVCYVAQKAVCVCVCVCVCARVCVRARAHTSEVFVTLTAVFLTLRFFYSEFF